MVAKLPEAYPAPVEPIASYDFTDIAEGTGMVKFEGTVSKTSTSTSFILVKPTLKSSQITTIKNGTGSITLDFYTSKFILPQTVKGTALLVATIGATHNSSARLDIQLKKGDGTVISAQITTPTFTGDGGSQETLATETLTQIPITNTTHFKKGEQIRMTIILTETGTNDAELGHDPLNGDGNYIKPSSTSHTTSLKLYIPFRIDI